MRLIDADKCFDHDPYYYDNEYDKYAHDLISAQPTVDAIAVEQVANFLMKFLDDTHPCNFVWFEEKMMDDEWCAYNCPIGENVKTGNECWLHAIKEGWLDDGTD